jgi:hypothetical protein
MKSLVHLVLAWYGISGNQMNKKFGFDLLLLSVLVDHLFDFESGKKKMTSLDLIEVFHHFDQFNVENSK